MEGLSSLVRDVGLFMESFGYIGARFVLVLLVVAVLVVYTLVRRK